MQKDEDNKERDKSTKPPMGSITVNTPSRRRQQVSKVMEEVEPLPELVNPWAKTDHL